MTDLHISLPPALATALGRLAREWSTSHAQAARRILAERLGTDPSEAPRRGRPTTTDADAARLGVEIARVGQEWVAVYFQRIVAHGRDRARVVREGVRRARA